MYENIVLPLHKRLMTQLKQSGQSERELVIGGNTSEIAQLMKQSGANIILCDYASDATAFKANLGDDSNIQIRRNINPVQLSEDNKALSEKFHKQLSLLTNPIAGTGILPYNFNPEKLINFINNAI
jgi:uroporphyrinogen-III decarboxylase